MKRIYGFVALLFCLASTGTGQQHGVTYHFPQWSPDGQRILVSAMLDGDWDLYVLSLRGDPPAKLTDNGVYDDAGEWIDGGRRIRFLSDRRGRTETFAMLADGSNPLPAEPDVGVVASGPDGRTELREENGVIVAVDRMRDARRPLSTGAWAEQGSFSPDGRSIVYEQRSSPDPHRVELSNIVVARADGTSARVVCAGTDPSWSPDGTRLLFKVWDASDKTLYVTTARPDGSEMRRLAKGVHPQWSPDGKQIVFMREEQDDTHVWVMADDGSAARCLTCGQK